METKKVKAALHNHLTGLGGKKPFNKIIDAVHKKLGADGVLGLIHFGNDWYKRVAESPEGYGKIDLGNSFYIPEKENLVFVNGQEVLTKTDGKEMHLLVLGHDKHVRLKNGRTIEDSIKEAKDNGGIVGIDHPFFSYGSGDYFEKKPELIEELKFVEVYNPLSNFGVPLWFANKKAKDFYVRWKKEFPPLGSIISDDGHSLTEAGRNWMKIPKLDLKNFDTVRESLKKGISIERTSEEEQKSGIFSSYFFASIHIGDTLISRGLDQLGFNTGIDYSDLN